MHRFSLSLIVAAALAVAVPSLAAAQPPPPDTTIPAPSPIVIKLGHTPVVELYDGGGGLPYLGSATSYNAGDWEPALRQFHDSGVYDTELAQIDDLADTYVAHRFGRRLALVLDIDETSLSNYTAINADNFTFGPQSQAEATNEIGVAIQPTLDLYNLAKAKRIKVFFITGRRENTREHTTHNLNREGYTGFTDAQLILKPQDSTATTVQYKSGARAAIEQQGYHIIANVGDQYSDLAGGHEDIGFKLPNPFYFLP
ncbi:MAG TPA: HAD family acid phosphatase [Solirubrobacteraceae bacterium]|jgi:acid phosphatase